MITARDYHPIRALLFWVLFSAGCVSLFVLNPTFGDSSSAAIASSVEAGLEEGILTGILTRSLHHPYGLGMITAGFGFILYAGVQWLALQLEVRPPVTGEKVRFGFRLLARLTGRPAASRVLLAGNPIHVDTGIDMLLHPLRYGQILFPAIGFIGTVIGISGAVRSLPAVLKDQSVDGLLNGLHIAFDTTFLGLVAAVFLGIALALLDLSHAQLKAVRSTDARSIE